MCCRALPGIEPVSNPFERSSKRAPIATMHVELPAARKTDEENKQIDEEGKGYLALIPEYKGLWEKERTIREKEAPALSSPPKPSEPSCRPSTNHLNPTGTS